MSVGLWFGFLKANTVTTGASVSLGVNIVQNRNSTKQNIGNFAVAGGLLSTPTNKIINVDTDLVDVFSFDNMNFTGPQI